MNTFHLNTKDIIKITGQRFFRRGLDYYKKGRVKNLTYNAAIKSYSAVVRGGAPYNVRIFFYEDGDLESRCNCPAYEAHGTCKHIAAVLLSISNHQQPHALENHQNEVETDALPQQLIDLFKSNKPVFDTDTSPLNFFYQLKETRQQVLNELRFEIELKVGEKTPYIIKDLPAFLEALDRNHPFKVTDKFTVDLRKQTLLPNDHKLLNLLNQALDYQTLYQDPYQEQNKRTIILPESVMHPLLKLLNEKTLHYQKLNQTVFSDVDFRLLENRIAISIETNEAGGLTVDFSKLKPFTFMPYYRLLVEKNQFYALTHEQAATLKKLYQALPGRGHIDRFNISKQAFHQFNHHVLPKLESLMAVHFSEDLAREMVSDPVEIKLYVETIGETISVTVSYQYGDYLVYPFSEATPQDVILMRDLDKEEEILTLLNQFGFHYMNQRFQLFNEEKIYQFIMHELPFLKDNYTVYLSGDIDQMHTINQIELDTHVHYDSISGYLDVSFDLNGIHEEEVNALLKAIVEKKQYHHVKQGPLIDLNNQAFDAFKAFAEKLQLKAKDIKQGKVKTTAAKSTIIDDVFTTKDYHQSFQQLVRDLKTPIDASPNYPEDLDATLRDYQRIGFNWFKTLSHYHLGGILADEMGLGKTLQAIVYILSEKQAVNKMNNTKQPALIIAPSSLIYNWKKEFEKFSPTLHVRVINGTQKERLNKFEKGIPDVWITSYPLLRQDILFYKQHTFDILILDEAQAIKNHLTKTARATRELHAKHRFALSGTPVENRIDELWSIFQTLTPGFLGPKKTFINLEHDMIKKMTKPFILRRLKTDVLKDLPEKFEFEKYAELTKEQKEVYLAYVKRINQKLDSHDIETQKLDILAGLTRLRQICCHPQLFIDNYEGHSGKLDLLKTIMHQLQEENRRVLIFSQFPSMLNIIEPILIEMGLKTFFLDGKTPSIERVEMAERFNEGENDVFLISLKAGGTGLNLTGADTVILFDLWWNPAVEAQAAGRAHRIGQTKKVEVIRLITEGTIEEKIFKLQEKKRQLVENVIEPGETLLSSLTQDEIKGLIQFDSETQD